jgi:transcriptional regulator with XRE-family HTH domain
MRFYAIISDAGDSKVAEFPDCVKPGQPDPCTAVAGPAEDIGRNAAAVLRSWLEAILLAGGAPPVPSDHIPQRSNGRTRGIEVPPLLALRICTRRARHVRGQTVREFAESIGLQERQIMELEHPAGEPSVRTIVRVTRELGLPYFPPSRREGSTPPPVRTGQPDLFPYAARSISAPPEARAAYTATASEVEMEVVLAAQPSLFDRMRNAAVESGRTLPEWLLGVARERVGTEGRERSDFDDQLALPF